MITEVCCSVDFDGCNGQCMMGMVNNVSWGWRTKYYGMVNNVSLDGEQCMMGMANNV